MQYYRCQGCLLVFSTLEALNEAKCGICESTKFDYMGRVHNNRLVDDRLAPPCDSRCTNAAGPECNCQCGSANHGTGMLINIIVDLGPVPVLKSSSKRADKHALMFQEFKAAKEAAVKAADNLLKGWISDKKIWWQAQHGIVRVLREANNAKTHSKRMKIVKNFSQLLTGANKVV